MKLGPVAKRISGHINDLVKGLRSPTSDIVSQDMRGIEAIELEARVLYSASPIPLEAFELVEDGALDLADVPVDFDENPTASLDNFFDTSDQLFTLLEPVSPEAQPSGEIVFIDSNVDNLDLLLSELRSPTVDVYVLQPDQDGIEQITEAIANHRDISAVHVISHGSAGQVHLGSTVLSNETIGDYTNQVSSWSDSMSEGADLLFYGCDLAADSDGEKLLLAIGELSGTDIAGSDDLTGHDSLGANWELEFVHGELETEVVTSRTFQAAWQSALASPLSDGTGAIWFTTKDAGSAGGVSFDKEDITQIGDPNLQLEPGGTNGTYEATGFSTDEEIRAIHVVQSSVTVGDTVLQRGDLLLAFGKDATIASIDMEREDVLLFRPDSINDYSSGTYSMFLEGIGGGNHLHAITLVESNVSVGGYSLDEGDLLIARSGSDDTDIYLVGINSTSLGATSTTDFDSEIKLIKGGNGNTNLDFGNKIEGLELIETTTTVGGRTLNAGTLLVNIDENNSQNVQGGVIVSGLDVFALDVNTTHQNGGTDVTASQLFDGSDTGLNGGDERLRGFSLISSPAAPTNQAPTFSFTPLFTQIDENTDTSSAIKIGDISITDDGLGTNNLSIAGADSAQFSIVGTEVFLNAGSTLDHESQDQFDIRIELDDPSIGTTAEQTELYSLTIQDVNEAPVLQSNAITIDRGETLVINSSNLRATDTDSLDLDSGLRFIVSNVSNGQFELASNLGVEITTFLQSQISAGQVVFVHDGSTTAPGYDIQVTDGALTTSATSASINFGNNFTPTAGTIADLMVNEDTSIRFLDLHSVFNDVEDSDSDLTYSVESNSNPLLFSDIQITSSGYLSLEFAADQNGSSTITIRATDTGGYFAETTSNVLVAPVNDDPTSVAIPVINAVEDDGNMTFDVSPYFDDVDILTNSDSLTFSINGNSNPTLVTPTIVGDQVTLDYQPNEFGTATIEIVATDIAGRSVSQDLTVNVAPVDDTPFVINPIDTHRVNEDAPQSIIDLHSTFRDLEEPSLSYNVIGNDNASLLSAVTIGDDLIIDYMADQSGVANVTVRAADSAGNFVDHVVEVTVDPVNNLPTVEDKSYITDDTGVVSGNILSDAADLDRDSLTAVIVTAPTNGTLALRSSGEFIYTPNPGFVGVDTFEFVATDGTGQSETATASLTVEGVPIIETNQPSNESQNDNDVVNIDAVLLPQPDATSADQRADEQPRKVASTRTEQPYSSSVLELGNTQELRTTQTSTLSASALPAFSAPAEYTPVQFTRSIFTSTSTLSFAPEMLTSLALFGDEIDEATNSINYAFVNSIVSFSGFSLIGATWFLRGGALLASMMANVPAWRIIDPLVVLRYASDEEEGDESLHDIVEGTSSEPAPEMPDTDHTPTE